MISCTEDTAAACTSEADAGDTREFHPGPIHCAPIPVYSNNNIIVIVHTSAHGLGRNASGVPCRDRGENKKKKKKTYNNNDIVTNNSTESFDLRTCTYRRHGAACTRCTCGTILFQEC